MNYEQLADDIVRLVGGTENVSDLTHCVTRLRFSLKDDSLAQTDEIKALKGVISVANANRQYQIIMGDEIIPSYNAIIAKYPALAEDGGAAPAEPQEKRPLSLKGLWEGLIDYLSGTMVQVIPLFIGCGLISCILTVANLFFDLDKTSSTYLALNAMAKVVFYFLPGFIGYAGARKLKCNPMLGAAICLFLQHTSLTGLVDSDTVTTFFGIPFTAIDYNSTVFPAFIGVWVLSKIEGPIYNVLPKMVKNIFGPFICLAIMCPLMLLVIGPVGYYMGQGLANIVLALTDLPFGLGCGLIAAFQPVLVMFGAHTVTAPIMIESLATLGYDALLRPAFTACTFGGVGALVAVAVKAKDPEFKSLTWSCAFTSFMGTSEPGMYGVMIPLARPFFTSMTGGFVGGVVASLLGARVYAMGVNGVFAFLVFGDTLPQMLFASAVAFAVSFVVTWLVGFDESKVTGK